MNTNTTASLLVLVSSLHLIGCSLVRTDPTETISLNTNPEGANCLLFREGTVVGEVTQTPAEVTVDRNKHDLSVICKKDGYQDVSESLKSGVSGTVFWNVLALDVVRVGIDAASGADNSYPDTMTINLIPIDSASQNSSVIDKEKP